MDEINIGPKRDFRLPSPRWFVVAATAGLIAAAATLIATTGGGRHVPQIPTAAPGTVLLTCESANWGRLPPNWRALSLRAGPLWFVGDRLFTCTATVPKALGAPSPGTADSETA